jgi:hypothetical protein
VPTTIGEIVRLTRMFGRARQAHVEEWTQRKRRKQICTHGGDAVAQAVAARVLGALSAAFGLMSTAVTFWAPARAAASAKCLTPCPHRRRACPSVEAADKIGKAFAAGFLPVPGTPSSENQMIGKEVNHIP